MNIDLLNGVFIYEDFFEKQYQWFEEFGEYLSNRNIIINGRCIGRGIFYYDKKPNLFYTNVKNGICMRYKELYIGSYDFISLKDKIVKVIKY